MSEIDDATLCARERVGSVLRGKWHLERILGIGGTACVYAATHRNRSRVAIKMLHPDMARNREMVSRFLREGYVGNAVGHAGAVKVLDDDIAEDGAPFLVMELLEGESLGDRIERVGTMSPNEVASVGARLLDVLAAAHDQNIVHRDLKPDNVFVTRDGTLKVLDFGIARLREMSPETSTGTLQGSILGTPAFMAPEQALGRWSEVDGRTDIWAVGATLFTLLSGRFVHDADTVQEQLVLAATRPAPKAADVAPAWLASIVDRALAFDPAARFPDARAMHAALLEASVGLELAPLSLPLLPVSLRITPSFDSDVATRTGQSATVSSVQAMARSASESRASPRTRRVLLASGAAAVLALSAFGFSALTPRATEEPASKTAVPAMAREAPRTVTSLPAAAVSPPLAVTGPPPIAPVVVPAVALPSAATRSTGPKAKPTAPTSELTRRALSRGPKPNAGEKAPTPDNPFDIRY